MGFRVRNLQSPPHDGLRQTSVSTCSTPRRSGLAQMGASSPTRPGTTWASSDELPAEHTDYHGPRRRGLRCGNLGLRRHASTSVAALLLSGSHGGPSRAFRLESLAVATTAFAAGRKSPCLLYTSDAADDLLCVDL